MSRPLSLAEAHRSLRDAQKPAFGAPAYSRWVNRPAGRLLAAGAYRVGLTPNQVTLISAGFTFLGIAALGLIAPSGGLGAAVAAMLVVGYALDAADGQLARLTGLGRPSGEWLDHTVDMAKIVSLHAAVLVSWWRWGPAGHAVELVMILMPLAFLLINVLAFFGWLLADLLTRLARARGAGQPTPDRGRARVRRSLLRLPSDYGLLALIFVVWATPIFQPVYGILLVANLAILVPALPVWFRQVKTVEGVGT